MINLTLNTANTLLYSVNTAGSFTVEVVVTKTTDLSAGAHSGTTLAMTEMMMPSGHTRVFSASFTPTLAGEYVLSFLAVSSSETLTAIQRGVVSTANTGAVVVGASL